MKQHPFLHRFVRKHLKSNPFVGFLSNYQWYRRIIGGWWERYYVSDPVDTYAWFQTDGVNRPPLCRSEPEEFENYPICRP